MKQSTKYLDQDILRQFLNLSAILAAFGINVLANIAPSTDSQLAQSPTHSSGKF
jgi:hypothetical protein